MRISRLNAIPVGIVAVYTVAVLAMCRPSLWSFAELLSVYAASLVSVWIMAGLSVLLFVMVRQHLAGTSSSSSAIVRQYFLTHWKADRFASALLPLLCCVPLIAAYNFFKQEYLPSAGFWFGPHIARTERAILGMDAWRITHGLLPTPWATQIIDLLYHIWFLPMIVGVALCSFARPGTLLSWRYLTSYALLWIVQGSALAYLFPAAGPALRAKLFPHSSFAALDTILQSQDSFLRAHGAPGLYAVQYQHALASLFGSPTVVIGGGISAMPSLHNAMAVLFACAAWSMGRRIGIVATVYALVIWVGSVHLGWHYALDGVVAGLLTLVTWFGVGRIPALLEQRGPAHIIALETAKAAPALADAA